MKTRKSSAIPLPLQGGVENCGEGKRAGSGLIRKFFERITEQFVGDGRRIEELAELGITESAVSKENDEGRKSNPRKNADSKCLFHVSVRMSNSVFPAIRNIICKDAKSTPGKGNIMKKFSSPSRHRTDGMMRTRAGTITFPGDHACRKCREAASDYMDGGVGALSSVPPSDIFAFTSCTSFLTS